MRCLSGLCLFGALQTSEQSDSPSLHRFLGISVVRRFADEPEREHRHEFMTVEHLLLALLSNPSAREALEACSVDLVALRQELEAFIEQTTPSIMAITLSPRARKSSPP